MEDADRSFACYSFVSLDGDEKSDYANLEINLLKFISKLAITCVLSYIVLLGAYSTAHF